MLIAGVLALVGLIVNVAVDLDNVYDMTTTALWLLTLILAFAGAFMGGGAGKRAPSGAGSSTSAATAQQQFKCSACGMTFNSQSDLEEHVKKAHAMPAR